MSEFFHGQDVILKSDIFTTTEAAQILGVNQSRIRQLLIAGRLTGRKHGPVWMLDRKTVERYAKSPQRNRRRKS